MDRKDIVFKKLTEVSDDEWHIAMKKCRELINWRVKGRTKFGCHSKQSLGTDPFNYYFKDALDKLYSGNWNWEFEKYTLSEQLHRMIGSIISEKVRKFKVNQKKKNVIKEVAYETIAPYIGIDFEENLNVEEKEKKYEQQREWIEKAIEGDEDMESVYYLILEGKSKKEIYGELKWPPNRLYKTTEKMKRRIKKYISKLSLHE